MKNKLHPQINSRYSTNKTPLRTANQYLLFISTIVMVGSMLTAGGCVERFITVTTRPAGALVWLNDQEVGATPVKVPFTWYGQYRLVIQKDGYETVNTSVKVNAPVYEWFGIDLFSECLWPGKLIDDHQYSFNLQTRKNTPIDPLIERARQLRNETLKKP